MGFRLVGWALSVRPGEITGTSRAVLVAMAFTAKDETPLYWGGHEYLALVIGYPKYSEAARRQVNRAIGPLLDGGVIARADSERPGRGRVYRLSTTL